MVPHQAIPKDPSLNRDCGVCLASGINFELGKRNKEQCNQLPSYCMTNQTSRWTSHDLRWASVVLHASDHLI